MAQRDKHSGTVAEEERHHHETAPHGHPSESAPPEEQPAPASPTSPATQLIAPPPFPALGKVPTSWQQLQWNAGAKASHFDAVACGPADMSAARGGALVGVLLQLDYSMGNFQIQVPFPKNGSLLFAVVDQLLQAYTTDGTTAGTPPTIALGTSQGGSDIAAIAESTTVGAAKVALAAGNGIPPNGIVWLNVSTNTGNVTGQIELAILFIPPFTRWS